MKKTRRYLLLSPVVLVGLWACPAGAHDLTPAYTMRILGEQANQGDPLAHYRLAYEYAVGDQIEQDQEKALALFHTAAGLGNPGAQMVLSHYYAVGYGVEADKAQAYKWALLAATHGSPVAKQLMPDFERTLTPEQHAQGQRLAQAWQVTPFEAQEPDAHGTDHSHAPHAGGTDHGHTPHAGGESDAGHDAHAGDGSAAP